MQKRGIAIEVPGFGKRVIDTVCGKLSRGVRSRLFRLSKLVDLRILTADTYGTACQQLKGIAIPHRLGRTRQDVEKREFLRQFDLRHVAAFGNGNNDRLMLAAVKKAGGLAIAVDNQEGCAVDALVHAHVFISGASTALGLLLNTNAVKATPQF